MTLGIKFGFTGFWANVSPAIGILSLFFGSYNWIYYNRGNGNGNLIKAIALIIIQLGIIIWLCIFFFAFNAPPKPEFYDFENDTFKFVVFLKDPDTLDRANAAEAHAADPSVYTLPPDGYVALPEEVYYVAAAVALQI